MGGYFVESVERAAGCWDRVIHGAHRLIRAAYFQAALFQACEGLGGGYFVNEVEVDINDCRGVCFGYDDVGVPDFVVERFHSFFNHRDTETQRTMSRRAFLCSRRSARPFLWS